MEENKMGGFHEIPILTPYHPVERKNDSVLRKMEDFFEEFKLKCFIEHQLKKFQMGQVEEFEEQRTLRIMEDFVGKLQLRKMEGFVEKLQLRKKEDFLKELQLRKRKDIDFFMACYQPRENYPEKSHLRTNKDFDFLFEGEDTADLIRSLQAETTLTVESLSECFVQTLSSSAESRHDADIRLDDASTRPHFPFALLRVIAASVLPSSRSFDVDKLVCTAATKKLKDYFCFHELSISKIPSLEKDYLKALIFCLMLSLPPSFSSVQSKLDDALALLCNERNQESWYGLLLKLILKLQQEALHTSSAGSLINAAKSIIGNFQQHQCWTIPFFAALRDCAYDMQMMVLDIFYQTAESIESLRSASSASNDTNIALHSLIHIQWLCCRILPFSHRLVHSPRWLLVSQEYLIHTYPPLEEELSGHGDRLSTIDKLRFVVCENMLPLMNNYKKRYIMHENGSSSDFEIKQDISLPVIILLTRLSASTSSSCDRLIVSALNCLMKSTFNDVMKSWHVYRYIVIPNVCLRDEDEILFKKDYHEFIRRDMGARDCHTRRGIAINLLFKLVRESKEGFLKMLAVDVRRMSDSVNWKSKECAIRFVSYIMMAEDAEGSPILSLNMECCCTTCSFIVRSVFRFFDSAIVRELLSDDVNEFPMLKAAALKFFNMYSDKVPQSLTSSLMPCLRRLLVSKSSVVQSYASVSILVLQEKLSASSSSYDDQLIVSALNCLMDFNLSNFMMCHISFGHILIRNVCLTDEDEILFERNYHEFIQMDMYASHCHTRRGIACNLIKKLLVELKGGFARMLSKDIRIMLNSMDWKSKECAIQLFVFLMAEDAEGNSILSGMEERGHDFLDVYSFFKSVIEPELQSKDMNEFPMLKAAALKFLNRNSDKLLEYLTNDLMDSVKRFLHSESGVVKSYATDTMLVLLQKFPASFSSDEFKTYEEETIDSI